MHKGGPLKCDECGRSVITIDAGKSYFMCQHLMDKYRSEIHEVERIDPLLGIPIKNYPDEVTENVA